MALATAMPKRSRSKVGVKEQGAKRLGIQRTLFEVFKLVSKADRSAPHSPPDSDVAAVHHEVPTAVSEDSAPSDEGRTAMDAVEEVSCGEMKQPAVASETSGIVTSEEQPGGSEAIGASGPDPTGPTGLRMGTDGITLVLSCFESSPLMDLHSAKQQEHLLSRLQHVVDVAPVTVQVPIATLPVPATREGPQAAQVRRSEKAEFSLLVKQVTGRSKWQEFRDRQRDFWHEPFTGRRAFVCAH